MRLPKVDIWKNGCGANVGKHVITFTGLKHKDYEEVYVTLKYPVYHFPFLFWINNRKPNTLRSVIKFAKTLKPCKS